jgi:hypothetical protein
MHVTRGELCKETKSDGRADKRSRGNSRNLWNFYKNEREIRAEENQQCKTKQKISRIKEENPIADETLAGLGSSIHVQPDELRRQARESKEKTPRWQPRGDDTQSFRPLVQEERGVLRVRLLALSTRVNTLFRLRQQKCS